MRSDASRRAGYFVEPVSFRLGHPSMLSVPDRESTHRGASVLRSTGEPSHPRDAPIGPVLAQAAKPSNQQRIMLESLLSVDESSQQLVVTCGAHTEFGADDLFFRTAVARPRDLEGEDRTVTICEVSEHAPRLSVNSSPVGAPLPPSP